MSVGDLRKNVITVYSAEITDQISKLGKIEDAEKHLAGTRKKGTDDAIKQLADLGHAMGTLGKIGSGIWSAYESSVEQAKLANASFGISIDNLSKASGGLQTRMELMTFAAKMQHSAFALSEAQMVTATKAIRELTREGYNQEEATKKVSDALLKLTGDSLKDFGIHVPQATNDAAKFNGIMDALAGKAKLVGSGTKTAAEEMATFGTSTTDSFDKIKGAIGRLTTAMGPLLDKISEAIGMLASASENTSDAGGLDLLTAATGGSGLGILMARAKKKGQIVDPLAAAYAGAMGTNAYGAVNPAANDNAAASAGARGPSYDWAAVARGFGQLAHDGIAQLKLSPESAHEIAKAIVELENPASRWKVFAQRESSNQTDVNDLEKWRGGESEKESEQFIGGLKNYVADFENTFVGAMTSIAGSAASVMEGVPAGPTALEKMFGKVPEIHGYEVAFKGLSDAATSGFNAMVDGTESFGTAFKHSIADSLKALGGQLLVSALKETAEGVAALAIGGPFMGASAARHFAAAAMFGAGAVAAGATANAIGTTAGDAASAKSSSAGASGGSGGGRGGGGDSNPRPIVIVTGDDQSRMTDRMRAQNARRALEQGLLAAGYQPGSS